MDGFLMTIGVFLLIATLVFVVVELWPMAPTKPSGTRGQEDEEPHFHFDDPTGTGRHAPV